MVKQKRAAVTIESAEHEADVTDLLDCLMEKDYEAAKRHKGMGTIRKLLEADGELEAPVIDLAAVLPDLGAHQLRGVHIGSYYALDDKNWYPNLLDNFFSKGVGGSLLALQGFRTCVGQYRIRRSTRKARGARQPMNTEPVPIGDEFQPTPEKVDYDIDDRFDDYAGLLFEHFDELAVVVWICFGPRLHALVDWGGSLFLVVRPVNGAECQVEKLNHAIDKVYGVLNASFHRAIVNTGYKQQAKHQLELTYFAFGHELKNRIDALRTGELRNKIRAAARDLLPDIDRCREQLRTLRGMAGVFSIVAKTQDGKLPSTWITPVDIPAPSHVPTEAECAALRSSLLEAATHYAYLEDSGGSLTVRKIENGGATAVKRPSIAGWNELLPPFSVASQEPHLCFLAGLAELCRNAARVVLSASPKHDFAHIDVMVEVARDESFVATVTIFNPVVGNQNEPSQSVGILSDLFKRLNNIIELHQARDVEHYEHAVSDNSYVMSRFQYFPKRISVAPRSNSREAV